MRWEIKAKEGEAGARGRHEALMDEFWAAHERALRAIRVEGREEMSVLRIDVSLAHFPNDVLTGG